MGWFTKDRSNEGNRPGPTIQATPTSIVRGIVLSGEITAQDYRDFSAVQNHPDYEAAYQVLMDAIDIGTVSCK